jgi:hypothetical protein
VNIAERIAPMPGSATNGQGLDSKVHEEDVGADRKVRVATGDAGTTAVDPLELDVVDRGADDLLDDEYDDVEPGAAYERERRAAAPRRPAARPTRGMALPSWLPERRWLVLIALAIGLVFLGAGAGYTVSSLGPTKYAARAALL